MTEMTKMKNTQILNSGLIKKGDISVPMFGPMDPNNGKRTEVRERVKLSGVGRGRERIKAGRKCIHIC